MRYVSDEAFARERLAVVPDSFAGEIEREWARKVALARAMTPGSGRITAGEYEANRWLADMTEKSEKIRIPLNASDVELRVFAKKMAMEAMDFIASISNCSDVAAVRGDLARFAGRYGIDAPGREIEDRPAIRRMTCGRWWLKKLRGTQCRAIESMAIELCKVHVRAQPYASDSSVRRRMAQRRNNAAALEAMEAINMDTGESCVMAEIVARSVANPRIRRGELMTRIAGFEHFAKIEGDAAKFMTLTCPSAYHRMRTADGNPEANPKWNGKTPKAAQKYLCMVWGNIHKKLEKEGVTPYGFRIAEPHHDGTPHWHLMVFVPRAQEKRFVEIFRHYALLEDGDEPGAAENRMECVDIDYSRGSAAGYVAKYVSKNIDGFAVQLDFESGRDGVTGSMRVEAWAATWRIRQFQQFGGPPVGVWRELRRMEADEAHSDAMAAARAAADSGDWCAFTQAMGGAARRRKDMQIRVARTRRGERWDYLRGAAYPANPTQYGDEAAEGVFGVMDGKRAFPSRRDRYEIRTRGAGSVGRKSEISAPWSSVNNCRSLAGNDGEISTEWRVGNDEGKGKTHRIDGFCNTGLAPGIGHHAGSCQSDSGGIHPSFGFRDRCGSVCHETG
ncbi:MAG: replication endonuclease [Zoogloeaceae bacterium]|jgi:hypothetical protein|nr:replication endonuclease [Zoogloeaceae bacterium]